LSAKIELLEGTLGKAKADAPNTNNSISAANLLNGVEKSYEKGNLIDSLNELAKPVAEKQTTFFDYKDKRLLSISKKINT